MPRSGWLAALACALFASTAVAAELPKVVVLSAEPPPPQGFVEALRIQAAGSFSVVQSGNVSGASLPAKLASSEGPIDEQKGSVGIWVERSGSGGDKSEFLVYVVTRRHDRVLVEVVRLPGTDSPETDRALALKVREVIETVLVASDEPDVAPAMVAPPSREAESRRARASVTPLLSAELLGASGGDGTGASVLGAVLGAGVAWNGRGFGVEALASGFATTGSEREVAGSRVSSHELGLEASLRGLLVAQDFSAGGFAGFGVRRVSALGASVDGREGSAVRWVPELHVGPEVRAALGSAVDLRAALGLELALRRQRFSVLGREVSDLGSTRATAEIGVVVRFE